MSVTEPSNAVKRRNSLPTGGRRLARSARLRPQLTLWVGLAGLADLRGVVSGIFWKSYFKQSSIFGTTLIISSLAWAIISTVLEIELNCKYYCSNSFQ